MREIKFGLPIGSLNHPGRWSTENVLRRAGFNIVGYSPGNIMGYPTILNHPRLKVILVRPQRAPAELCKGNIDIAILGNDWAEEGFWRGLHITELCDLKYGNVTIVAAVSEDLTWVNNFSDYLRLKASERKPIRCYTEYLYIAKNFVSNFVINDEVGRKFFGIEEPRFEVKGEIIRGGNSMVEMIGSEGATELSIPSFTDLIIDNTQTGKTLKSYHLKVIEKIRESSARLYCGPHIAPDASEKWVYEEISLVKSMLQHAIE